MFYDSTKRIIDFVGAIFLAIIFLPIWIIIPILLKLDSKGPILYSPERVGKNGKIFKMLKFRSMRMFQIKGKAAHAVEFWKANPDLSMKNTKETAGNLN